MHRKLPLLLAAIALAAAGGAPAAQARSLIAPAAVCPDQDGGYGHVADRRQTIVCMTNFARRGAGLQPLAVPAGVQRSAAAKSADILHCDSFSHFACGRDFTYRIRLSARLPTPCWRAGENLAWGTAEAGKARAIFRAWMASPPHRRNILGGYSQLGVGLKAGRLGDRRDTQVWTQHFLAPCR